MDHRYLGIAGVAVVVAFAIATLACVRAVGAMSRIIRDKKPDGWRKGIVDFITPGDGNPNAAFWEFWILDLLLGIRTLDLRDENYRKYLWAARWSFLLTVILFFTFIFGLGALTRGSIN